MKNLKLVKSQDRWDLSQDQWDLYNPEGYKVASTLKGCKSVLSIKNCEAIERGYDLVELIDIELNKLPYTKHLDDGQFNDGQLAGFELGAEWAFQKALELMGDKKFSEEDVKNLIDNFHSIYEDGFGVASDNKKQRAYKLIQSLKKNEWDVEVQVDTDGWLILKRTK
jgi:hypothetical protein